MIDVLEVARRNFTNVVPEPPGRPVPPPVAPPPAVELTVGQVLGRPALGLPVPADLPDVAAAQRQLAQAEQTLARLEGDLAQARSSASSGAATADDLERYAKTGKPPAKDAAAREAADELDQLGKLLPRAKEAVAAARLAAADARLF